MLFPDLSLTLSQRRRACVLDPALILSRFGLPLARRLGEVLELWVPREFWHILDNSQFYLRRPELLFQPPGGDHAIPDRRPPDTDETIAAIREWERIRLESDLSGLNFFWIGDGLPESLVPTGVGADLVWRYEALARALDRRLAGRDPMTSAARDTTALAAALGGAFVLTYRTTEDMAGGIAPALCTTIGHCLLCERVCDGDPIAAIECDYLRRLLVHAAAAGLVWSGLNLAVLHLAVPGAASLRPDSAVSLTDDLAEVHEAVPTHESSPDPWDGACAFWYQLSIAQPAQGKPGKGSAP